MMYVALIGTIELLRTEIINIQSSAKHALLGNTGDEGNGKNVKDRHI